VVQAALDGLYRIVWSETILQEATERMLDLLTKALTSVGPVGRWNGHNGGGHRRAGLWLVCLWRTVRCD
jgi:hypothetical protein